MRYVADDVAVYNDDLIGGRMKELLFGLTSTLPQVLPALYRVLEVRRDDDDGADSSGFRLRSPYTGPHTTAFAW